MKKKIKKLINVLSKKSKAFRSLARFGLNTLKKIKYKKAGIGISVDEKTLVFSCFDGKSYADSPKAIYQYMSNSKDYKDYKFIWFFKYPNDYKFLENKNTKIVKSDSEEYWKYLNVAKYWVFNYKIADFIKPKKNQIFLQCWHGTPLKRLGCDLLHYDSPLNDVADMKKRYKIEASKFDYFISPSKFATKCFTSAWNLKEIGKENIIIEKGYPRNDFLFNYTNKDVIKFKKQILGNEYKTEKKLILYAPTYRANQHESGVGYTYKTEVDFDNLRKKIGDEFIILFRPHYFVANAFDFKKYEGFVYDASKIDDVNDLYVISDILITDYSSVFFDYANLKRPIIFYMYDLDYYKNKSNGFYFNVEKTLPGPIVKTEKDLIKAIKDTKKFKYDKKYEEFNNKFNYLDDGESSKRVIEEIIK